MAFFQYLVFDGENLPLPDSYEVELEDVEADSGGETEAGTTQRDVVRHGVARIPVSFSVTAKWLKKLAGYAKKDKISVQYFDVETAELKLAEMYVTGYKAKLKKDTSYKGLWTVSFTLKMCIRDRYEHREEADHHQLVMDLRSLLFGVRKPGF